MATKSRPTLLPLELAASFLVPHTASLARTCKRLLIATTSPKECNAAWIDLFRRRFPCLANLEKFKHPADARKLVQELLAATPSPLWRPLNPSGQPATSHPMLSMPPCPRDEAGRLMPLGSDVTIAVQLISRGATAAASVPQLYGAVCLDELNLKNATENISMGEMNPQDQTRTLVPLKRVNAAASYFPDEIQVDAVAQTSTPSYGAMCDSHDEILHGRAQQELYAVVGDDVYLLLNRRGPPLPALSTDELLEHLYPVIRRSLLLGVEQLPFVSIWSSEVTRGESGESDSVWRYGHYSLDNNGKLTWHDKSWVWIHFDLPSDDHTLTGHGAFCRALAATPSVRFQRAPGQ